MPTIQTEIVQFLRLASASQSLARHALSNEALYLHQRRNRVAPRQLRALIADTDQGVAAHFPVGRSIAVRAEVRFAGDHVNTMILSGLNSPTS